MKDKNKFSSKYIILFLLLIIFPVFHVDILKAAAFPLAKDTAYTDTIPLYSDNVIQKSIYFQKLKKRSKLYDRLWGKHYRELYSTPITVNSISLKYLFSEVTVTGQANDFGGVYIKDKNEYSYLLKPLGGSTSFLKSDFFQEMYNKRDFEDTYLDEFIGDAYTIINPYTFITSDYLAKKVGLNTNNPHLYYIPKNATSDTIADGGNIQDKLVSIVEMPDLNSQKSTFVTEELFKMLQTDKLQMVDQQLYIRERLFDILIGDWNKIPENWNWVSQNEGDSVIYQPIVIDRSHAFTRVDGLLFKQMLSVLGLGFISEYKGELKNVKKENSLGFTFDVALSAQSDESLWLKQADYVKRELTDEVIDNAFNKLPKEIQAAPETLNLKEKLKKRRDSLNTIAREYYKALQENPVLVGTTQSDSIIIDKYSSDSLQIRMYSPQNNTPLFDRRYAKKNTKEIWIYGLDGNDKFEVKGKNKMPVFFIGGKDDNTYNIEQKSKVRIYGYHSQKNALDSVDNARIILSDNDNTHDYDYNKSRYRDISFSPWGFYDSDWGLSLGSFVTYTQYGFKRAPFSYQHRLGYNYLQGFLYRGIFPTYDENKSMHIDAFIGSPENFNNFFGFGNNTNGYKDERNDFNRVNIGRYSLTPSYHLGIDNQQTFIFSTSFEMYKVKWKEGRFVSQFFGSDDHIFNMNYFADFGVTYDLEKALSPFIPVFRSTITAGWKMNLADLNRNFPYSQADIMLNFQLIDRVILATNIKAKAIFNNKYEFYQSASTELRGYRDSRFIGQYSYYQLFDARVDMGKIKNPFTPLKYGLFVGSDFGRVWYPGESSKKWHTSYGGGAWLTIINKITTKYSIFGSGDSVRFMFELGMGF
ncbi:hypothetical protein [Dysgonomonas sp. ZJ709]|uniref:hypothetical protein n=1 Tax=Dysgonomonas sp. ZJ709 TaxID=2709797 RepID=UPI0013ED31DB|nr:hypothetical protein [Dysgonomonas sp. ZJ709]